jgi:hypothetical protein
MRIVEAERQLIEDLLGETRVTTSKTLGELNIRAGHHETLGRLVIIQYTDGRGVIVEIDE